MYRKTIEFTIVNKSLFLYMGRLKNSRFWNVKEITQQIYNYIGANIFSIKIPQCFFLQMIIK